MLSSSQRYLQIENLVQQCSLTHLIFRMKKSLYEKVMKVEWYRLEGAEKILLDPSQQIDNWAENRLQYPLYNVSSTQVYECHLRYLQRYMFIQIPIEVIGEIIV